MGCTTGFSILRIPAEVSQAAPGLFLLEIIPVILFNEEVAGNVQVLKTHDELQLLVGGSYFQQVEKWRIFRKEVWLCVFKQCFSPCTSSFALDFVEMLHVQTATD